MCNTKNRYKATIVHASVPEMQGGSVTIDAERFLALEKTVRDRLADWRHSFLCLFILMSRLIPASIDLPHLQDSAGFSWSKSRKTRPPMAQEKVPPPQILLNPVVIHLEGSEGDDNHHLSPLILTPFP